MMHWTVKVLIQCALAHLPGGEKINHRLQWMNGRYTPERMRARVLQQARKFAKLMPHIQNGMIVEVGTGWELVAPILFYLFGSRCIYTYDHLRHLRFDVPKIVIDSLDAQQLSKISGLSEADLQKKIEILTSCASLEDLLRVACITYCAPGDACDTGLPEHSIDLFFSYEVLEHVPESVLEDLVAESKRLLRPTGISYHAIEPGDHYTRENSHINHYRYPEWLWQLLVKNNISYHNRLCMRQFHDCFLRHGAEVVSEEHQQAEHDLAALKNGFRRDRRFSSFTPEELAIWYSEVIYRFPH